MELNPSGWDVMQRINTFFSCARFSYFNVVSPVLNQPVLRLPSPNPIFYPLRDFTKEREVMSEVVTVPLCLVVV